MSWKRFKNKKTDTSLPIGLATWSKINSLINKRITEREYEYHESEALEVTDVVLNEIGNRGSISGAFLNSGEKSGIVKPLKSNKTAVPVKGEHVVVTEYNGQQYYTDIINRVGKVSENSIPGASGTYDRNTTFGKEFKSKKVKPIEIGEGCVVYEGRFGQTIHLDGHKNKPTIKISTHIDESDGTFRKENIDNDDSSIYITSDGLGDQMFNGQEVKGKKVLIQSNGIFIKGRKEIKIDAPNVKLGSKDADQSVIKGEDLVDFLNDMLTDINTAFNKAMTAITPGGVVVTGGGAAIPIFATDILALQTKLATESTKFKSKIVKTV